MQGKRKEAMAAMFLSEADRFRYGQLKNTLMQNMSMRANHYPWSMEETMNIINNMSWGQQKSTVGQTTSKPNNETTEMVFAQSGKHKNQIKIPATSPVSIVETRDTT